MADTDGGEKRINLGDKETCHLKCETTTSGFVTSNEHQQYILQRHGTLELDPLPSSSPNDPLNWPVWKKNTQLLMVAFHAMMATFMAAGIIPGFQSFSVNYGITIEEASYLTSVQVSHVLCSFWIPSITDKTLQILVLGVWPLFWNPISKHFGRRPVFLISTIGSCICNIGGAFCTSYGAQMSTRILTAILICPPLGIGSGVVTELFFRREHAQKLGWWTLLLTIGIPLGPFIMGFVVQHLRVNWIFGILAIINFCQFLGYLWLQGEVISPIGDINRRRHLSGAFYISPYRQVAILIPRFSCAPLCVPARDSSGPHLRLRRRSLLRQYRHRRRDAYHLRREVRPRCPKYRPPVHRIDHRLCTRGAAQPPTFRLILSTLCKTGWSQ